MATGVKGSSSAAYFCVTSKLGELCLCQHWASVDSSSGETYVPATSTPLPALAPLSLSGDNFPMFQGLNAGSRILGSLGLLSM